MYDGKSEFSVGFNGSGVSAKASGHSSGVKPGSGTVDAAVDVDKDLTSAERCLADALLLLAEQQVGRDKLWLLPQTQRQKRETLQQSSKTALAALPAAVKATFLRNAPCGVYKYKLPRVVWTDSSVGTKVFFFKAILSDSGPPAAPSAPFLWMRRSKLLRYLQPAYTMKVEHFILRF